MNSKEKAEELILKFMRLQEPNYNWFDKKLGKKCALIAVDELLEHCYEVMKPFWNEVKQEIEKL
jgi:nitrogenase molybdenum-iron protein alpha/beta subunit